MKSKLKNPYLKRENKSTEKAFKSVEKSVKPVAKDTNKTRRKIVKPGVLKVEKSTKTMKKD